MCDSLVQALRSTGGSDHAAQLRDRVLEHASWLEANTSQQLQSYVSFIDERTGMADGASASVGHAAEEGLNIFDGRQPGSVALAVEEAETDPVAELEQRVRNVVRSPGLLAATLGGLTGLPLFHRYARLMHRNPGSFFAALTAMECVQVMETTSSAGGAAGVAAVLTTVLPTTLEDLMALALSGALSYVSFLNWPLKRADIKSALAAKYEAIATRLDAELSAELAHSTDKLRARIHRLVAPLLRQAEAVQATVVSRQSHLSVRSCLLVARTHCTPRKMQRT
jgi:hypothetical protein